MIPFATALRVWVRVALNSFGGPAGQIAVMHNILVEEKRWIGEERFLHALNYCMLLPGPEAQQLAIYIGWLLHGYPGGLVAGSLFVLPGFLAILALSYVYAAFRSVGFVAALFFGLKAAVLAVVVEAVVRIGRRVLKNRAMLALAALLCVPAPAAAIPPLVSGDVPTAPRETFEFFVGCVFRDSGEVETQEVPFWELVYGLSDRQEVTIEAPVVVREDANGTTAGLGDAVVGTKLRLVGEPAADAGLSVSLEIKLPTGDPDRGLGSGATDVDLRARWGWQIRSEVVYMNLGHTWIGEREGESLDDTWFYATVWDHPLGRAVRLLAEIYGRTADDPGGSNRLAATLGTKWKHRPTQQIQFSVGRSLRDGAAGGPRLRVYAGWRRDF